MTEPQAQTQTTTKINNSPTINQLDKRWEKFLSAHGNNYFLNQGSAFINDPYLLNQRIKQLKTLPSFLNRDEIEKSLLSPEYNEMTLRTATHSMLYMTYPLYRLQMLYEGILKYRNYISPQYVKSEDMDTKRFKSDWKFVDMWQKKLASKKQFRRIVTEVLAEGKRAYYLRQSYNSTTDKESVDYVHFQDLPSDWYKIVKHSTESYAVIAFNFAYFWQAGTSLSQFPPIFEKYYNELMNVTLKDGTGKPYIDLSKVNSDAIVEYNDRTLSWYYWKELPSDECFVFSFTESDDLQISPFSSLLLQAQDLGSYSLLQQQLLAVPLYSMLLGEIPMFDDNKSGSHLDDYALSPDAVSVFEDKVNRSMPPGTTYNMIPSTNNQLHHFQEIPNANKIYNMGLQQMINTSGASTLMTTTEKPSVAQVNGGKIIETRFIDRIYEQFEWAVNIILDNMYKNGDLKFSWRYRIFGDSFSEKDEISNVEKSLTLGQVELFPKFLAYHDMTLMDAVDISEWVKSTKIYDNFKPLINTFTQSNKVPQKTGRKKKSEDEIDNDNTANSIDSGQNTGDMKSYSTVCSECGKQSESEYYPFCSAECKEQFIEENGEGEQDE